MSFFLGSIIPLIIVEHVGKLEPGVRRGCRFGGGRSCTWLDWSGPEGWALRHGHSAAAKEQDADARPTNHRGMNLIADHRGIGGRRAR